MAPRRRYNLHSVLVIEGTNMTEEEQAAHFDRSWKAGYETPPNF